MNQICWAAKAKLQGRQQHPLPMAVPGLQLTLREWVPQLCRELV